MSATWPGKDGGYPTVLPTVPDVSNSLIRFFSILAALAVRILSKLTKSDHTRSVHSCTYCGCSSVRLERSEVESKASVPALCRLFDFAAGAATLRANGQCVLPLCCTVPMFCGLI
jgi:hypothetical protein